MSWRSRAFQYGVRQASLPASVVWLSAEERRWSGVIDKETTGVSRVAGDGSGVIIGILDTGVDPAAEGMGVTPRSEPKILDVIDATGAGDVDTSTIVESGDGWIENPITGRRLYAGKAGTYRVGGKKMDALWPRALRERLAREARLVSDSKYHEWYSKAFEDSEGEEFDARVEALGRAKKDLEPTRDSVAPILDVVVTWDEEAQTRKGFVVDGSKTPNLDDAAALADFGEATRRGMSPRYGKFGESDLLTYSLSFYGDDVTTIVTPSGDHGTHVASIAAAYDPNDADKCGLAPGAKLVSIKIGDARLGTMETGVALNRAAIAAQKWGCDLINLSYGEACGVCDAGAFATKAKALVDENPGLLFVSSAGNNGPALSTVGAPGSTTGALLGIGAYVTPEMRADMYAQRQFGGGRENGGGGMMYSFSSRGPATDGDWGVSVAAPGGAIASVPKYTLQPQRLMHGTSMSSPNAAGALACLLSALKSEKNVSYSPASVRRAIEDTARPFEVWGDGDSPTDQGKGILAVDLATDAILRDQKDASTRYEIRVMDRGVPGVPARGIYLREPHETSTISEANVQVVPKFSRDSAVSAERKASFRRNVALRSSADWVEAGERVVLTYDSPKTLIVKIDPTALAPDAIHCAEIKGYDADDSDDEKPPLFRVPITVLKPIETTSSRRFRFSETLAAGTIARHLVVPPEWAASATVSLRCSASDASKRLVHLSTVQLEPHEPYSALHLHKRVLMGRDDRVVAEISDVAPKRTLEVCLSQDWHSIEPCSVEATVDFKADLVDSNSDLVLRGTRSVATVLLSNKSEDPMIAAPVGKLKKWRRPLRPRASAVAPCASESRDSFAHYAAATIAPKRAYELTLEYDWEHLPSSSTGATFRFSGDDQIYESPFEGQHARVFDKKTGKVLGYRDARSYSELKGFEQGAEYGATLTVRSESIKALEKLRDAELWVEWPLAKDASVRCFGTKAAAYDATDDTFKDVKLRPGDSRPLFVSPPLESDIPKNCEPGDVLLGTISYARSPSLSKGASKRRSHTLWYHVPPKSKNTAASSSSSASSASAASSEKKKKSSDDSNNNNASSSEEEVENGLSSAARKALDKALFSRQLKFLADEHDNLDDDGAAALTSELLKLANSDKSKILQVRRAALKRLVPNITASTPLSDAANATKILAAAGALSDAIDQTAVAVALATRETPDDLLKSNAEEEEDRDPASHKALLEALRWTAEARLALVLEGVVAEKKNQSLDAFSNAIADLDKWVETKKSSHAADARLRAEHDRLRNRPGLALQTIDAWLDTKKKSREDLKRARDLRAKLYDDLGWDLWAQAERNHLRRDFPHPKLS